jgi:hypothetical protein
MCLPTQRKASAQTEQFADQASDHDPQLARFELDDDDDD